MALGGDELKTILGLEYISQSFALLAICDGGDLCTVHPYSFVLLWQVQNCDLIGWLEMFKGLSVTSKKAVGIPTDHINSQCAAAYPEYTGP